MAGKKGRSGRKRKYESHPLVDRVRKYSLAYYYKHRKERNKATQEYYAKNAEIIKYANKHGLSIPEARERLKKEKKSEQNK